MAQVAFIMFFSLILFLIIGVPISVSVGASAVTTILCCYPDLPVMVIAQRLFTSMDNVSIMAIPFFVLAGNLMTNGGISKMIVEFVNCFMGNVRGGLGYTAIVACAFFAALSGSAPATVLAIGSMLYPEMAKIGYPKARCAGLLAVSGGLGPVIPPSIIMVVYCTITGASVTDMFSVGIIVGILIAIVLCTEVYVLCRKEAWPQISVKWTATQIVEKFMKAFPALLMPVLILGSIYSGLMTATESSATAVVYAFIIGVFVYKQIKIRDLPSIILSSAKSAGMILFIIATASSFSWLFTYADISEAMVSGIVALNMSKKLFCVLIAIVLLFFGTFLEGTAICVLLVPVLWPVAMTMGLTAVQFGLIVCLAGVIGAMTPPVAVNIFAACSISKLSIAEVTKGEMPFFLGFVGVLMLIALFPEVFTLILA